MKVALGLFLVAHGLVHLALWLPTPADAALIVWALRAMD